MTTRPETSPYHLLGPTGLRVSPLELGAMTFGNDDLGWGADKDTSRASFHRYVEVGGNFIAYGKSEELLGGFMEETGWRDQLVLTTKFTASRRPGDPNAQGNGSKNILASLDASLRRLRTSLEVLLSSPVPRTVSATDLSEGQGLGKATGKR